MKPWLPRQMVEATRLTKAGRLTEAVAFLQSALRGDVPGDASGTQSQSPAVLPLAGVIDAKLLDATGAVAPRAELSSVFDRLDFNVPGLRGLSRRSLRPADIAPVAGQFIAGSFSSEAGTRSYKLYMPSGYRGEPAPLIVMLHGCTQSPDDFAAGTRMNFAAEEQTCFVAYPEQSQAANTSKCWNWFKQGDQQRGRGEPALIAGITRQVMKDYKIDARRVYIAGLSAGGAAAANVGEAYPDLYAAVGVHSGLACGAARDLPSAFAAMRGHAPLRGSGEQSGKHAIPTIVFHGDRDATVHPRNGAEVIARANPGGEFHVSSDNRVVPSRRKFTRTIQRDARGRVILELWDIHGAGHAWSGGNLAGSFTDPLGPDATQAMLRFFLDHKLAKH